MISFPKEEKPKKKIGKLIRMEAEQWDKVTRVAKKNGLSLNRLIVFALEEILKKNRK